MCRFFLQGIALSIKNEVDEKGVKTMYSGSRLYGTPRDRVFLSLISVVQLTGPGRPGDRNMRAN